MIRAIAALALLTVSSASLSANSSTIRSAGKAEASSDALLSAQPWWEKLTVTIAGDGQARSCRWESSLAPNKGEDCDVAGSKAGARAAASGHHGSSDEQYTRITFERRFSPGAEPTLAAVAVGDTLLGRQDLALAIDSRGLVKGCRIVSSSGDMTPDYGCSQAQAERFQTSAATSAAGGAAPRQGTMSVLVYGHAEHVV